MRQGSLALQVKLGPPVTYVKEIERNMKLCDVTFDEHWSNLQTKTIFMWKLEWKPVLIGHYETV